MRVVVAPDAFGPELTGREAAMAIAAGWARAAPDDELASVPMSTGGPGFLDTLDALDTGGRLRPVPVSVVDPWGRAVPARVLLDGAVAYVESAQAYGRPRCEPGTADPAAASSWGVGQLLRAAADCGVTQVVVGLGGVGIPDGGAGLLSAVGLTLLDGQQAALPSGSLALHALHRVQGHPALRGVDLVMATDDDDRATGSARAPGADTDGVAEAALARLAEVLQRDLSGCPPGLAALPGAGAAGGMGTALLALGARRTSGFALVAARGGLPNAIAGADLVLTGQARWDYRALRGGVCTAVAELALEHGVPCVVLAGEVSVGRREQGAAGVQESYAMSAPTPTERVRAGAPAERLAALATQVARTWSR